jgi:hypothetical protein
MKCQTPILLAIAALAAFAQNAQATFIDGTVDIIGTASVDGTSAVDATKFTGFTASVDVGTGSYAGTGGATVSIQPFSFNPASGAINNLWSFSFGGKVYSFDLASLVLDFQGIPAGGPGLGVIRVAGTGTAHITGLQDTPASWVLHASGGETEILLAMGSTTTGLPPSGVPDAGSSWMLLGTALSGVGLLRKIKR